MTDDQVWAICAAICFAGGLASANFGGFLVGLVVAALCCACGSSASEKIKRQLWREKAKR